MTEQELKDMWVFWVQKISGVRTYYLSPSYNKHFKKAIKIIEENKIEDVNNFIRIQIRHACSKSWMITPVILAGNSYYRFMEADPYDRQVRDAKNSFRAEYLDFQGRKDLYGFEHAIRSHLEGHSPLFIMFATIEEGKEVSSDLRIQALRQITVEPEYKEVYPSWFINTVMGDSNG